jgi:hypothetical protein
MEENESMTILDRIKTRIYLMFNADQIYFDLIDNDLMINNKISGIGAISWDRSKSKLLYRRYTEKLIYLSGRVRYITEGGSVMHYGITYCFPKEHVLYHKKFILYMNLLGRTEEFDSDHWW